MSELLAASEDARVLVFSHFGQALELISDLIGAGSVASLLGHREQREAAVLRFESGDARVLLLPYASQRSSGLNLTAANHVVLAEPAVVPGEEDQAIGRAYRLGQRREVHIWPFAPSVHP